MRHLRHFPIIAALVLSGCATSPTRPPPLIKPSLDQSLAANCQVIGETPTVDDYDVLQNWVQDVLIPRYVDCAIRHRKTVDAWPK